MITMICSVCGTGHTEKEFQDGKVNGCKMCKNNWFYTNNEHNKNKVAAGLISNNLPVPHNLKSYVKEPERPTLIRRKPERSLF